MGRKKEKKDELPNFNWVNIGFGKSLNYAGK